MPSAVPSDPTNPDPTRAEPTRAEPTTKVAAPAVLVTRPRAAAADTGALLRAMGYQPVLAPLLDIHQLPAVLPDPSGVQAVLVTSARALPALKVHYHPVRLLAVGAATAQRARDAGHLCVESADGDAEDLFRLVQARCDPAAGSLLLLSGRGEGGALARRLRTRFRLEHRFVYAAVPTSELPIGVAAALRHGVAEGGQVVAALFFSAATARVFVSLAEAAGLRDTLTRVSALAISAETAAALAGLPWRVVRVAPRPNQEELLALLP